MNHLVDSRGLSTRRACQLVGQPTSTHYYRPSPALECRRAKLGARIHQLAEDHACAGYRTVHAHLRLEGERVNHKAVERVWRQDGLAQRKPPVKRRVPGDHSPSSVIPQVTAKNEVWGVDFVHDSLEDNRPFRIFTALDQHTRQCVALDPAFRIGHQGVINYLTIAIREHGRPKAIRMDNGPELIASGMQEWLAAMGIEAQYIKPGSPWQNGFTESFNGTFRHELLDRELFTSITHATARSRWFKNYYNQSRPHSGLRGLPPDQFHRGSSTQHESVRAAGMTRRQSIAL
ncbi:MAG: IS3 family transposase [Solirubrobacterales bacterium]|nr:IS3 family transposase [Solirubrobacterales bacterium]